MYMTDKNRFERKKGTMASQQFAKTSDQEIEYLIERAVPENTKIATKYGMKSFNGKIKVLLVYP